MTDIDREMARILESARGCHDPSPRDMKRVSVALAATIGGLGASTMAASSAAAATTAAATGTAGLVKLAAIGLIVGSAMGSTGWLVAAVVTDSSPSKAAAAREVGQSNSRTRNDALPLAAQTPVVGTDSATPVPSQQQLSTVARQPTAAAEAPLLATATPAPPRTALAEEVAALRRAQENLERNPVLALRQLDAMQAEHPQGALSEEATVARVLAYCKSGQLDEAQQTGMRFFAQYPTSVHAPRVRASCVKKMTSDPTRSAQSPSMADGSDANSTMKEKEALRGRTP